MLASQINEGCTMPNSEAKNKWDRENSIVFSIKLMKKTDADIIEFLNSQLAQGISKGQTIKIALREYITTITTPAKGEKGQGEK